MHIISTLSTITQYILEGFQVLWQFFTTPVSQLPTSQNPLPNIVWINRLTQIAGWISPDLTVLELMLGVGLVGVLVYSLIKWVMDLIF